jgi:L-alanine-DL-glutamate epimerase-like enolase superfamily enzyme
MIDSNQSWSLRQATEALQSLQDHNPLFAEEPIAANAPLSEWESLAKSTNIPLAGGENIYGVDRFIEMANAGLTVLQPDVAKWGGLSGALALAGELPHGAQLWPHFMGTAVGQMASLTITAAAGTAGSLCEMDVNRNALRTDLCRNIDGDDAMQIMDGCVNLHQGPGLVTEPSDASLQRFAVSNQ